MKEQLKELVLSLGAECGCIMFFDESENLLYCAEEFNLPKSWKALTNEPDESSMNGLVYSSGEAIIKNNLLLKLAGHEVKSVLIVPIEKDLQIIGTIEVVNKKNSLFDKKDRDKAINVAEKISDSV